MVVKGGKIMGKPLIYDKPMTKAQANERYKDKMKCWKNRNYSTFCFHLPIDLVNEFRKRTKANGDTQRQLVIQMMKDYIENDRRKSKDGM